MSPRRARAGQARAPLAARSGTPELGERRIDPEALLAALVLVPGSHPRNRFASLFRCPEAMRARRRAAAVRSIIGDLVCGIGGAAVELDSATTERNGAVLLSYRAEAVRLARAARLTPLEIGLVRFAVARVLHADRSAVHKWRRAVGVERLGADAAQALPQFRALLMRLSPLG